MKALISYPVNSKKNVSTLWLFDFFASMLLHRPKVKASEQVTISTFSAALSHETIADNRGLCPLLSALLLVKRDLTPVLFNKGYARDIQKKFEGFEK